MPVRPKLFSQFVETIEELKPSLSKQHNKMLKIKSEMLKIRKKWLNDQAQKNFRKNFLGISRIPRIFGVPEISRESRKIF